jgi:hypothetical protein
VVARGSRETDNNRPKTGCDCAATARARISEGYGDTRFQAAALIFPTVGCWQMTGKVGESSLTFVTLVVKAEERK